MPEKEQSLQPGWDIMELCVAESADGLLLDEGKLKMRVIRTAHAPK